MQTPSIDASPSINGSPDYYDMHNIAGNSTLDLLRSGISEYGQLYVIILLTLGFMNYQRGWQFYVRRIVPLVDRYIRNNPTNLPAIGTSSNTILNGNKTSLSNSFSSSSLSTTAPDKNGKADISEHNIPPSHTVTSSLKATGMDLQDFQPTKSSVLDISESVLGYGSHGTVVYKGIFDGRAVAVKRLLIDFYDVAYQEVKLLQESDDHPNVIRYFYKEESDRFLYIALELCFGSLQDCMDRSLSIPDMKLYDQMDPANTLYQITSGIRHLHSLKIVHRDLKPQNILLAPTKHQTSNDTPAIRILISDFGLCKKLDGEQSSFHYTAASPAGTSGWRAPELLAGALAASASSSDHTSFSNSSNGNGSDMDPNRIGRVKATRAIDIFSAGCIFYYVLSNGDHPFGNRFGRENNILKGDYDITKLEDMGEDGMEAMDLIDSMINTNPRSRPTADKVLAHPFFWSTSKRLSFLQDASDRFEVEQRDPPSPLLQCLEKDAKKIVGYDWYRRIDRVVVNDLGKFRKYDGKRVRDLLRALRNKKHHWQDLPDPVKRALGEPPDQYLYYFTARFPRLLLHTYHIISNDDALTHEGALRQYF
ncbi:kinase-like domain-containing protein [Absidia repens]|uniref:non-specific serine/threonine protein kinase n=1 Tax=Absidia repens TaxID=90262 RepID=A0A1X2IAG6_9FUNG|nr:kinase-like domain-containing protein [Absidia repens]